MTSHSLASKTILGSKASKDVASRWDARRTQRPATKFEKLCGAIGLNTPALWLRRMRQRNELASVEPRLLRDVGLDPVSVCHEIEKPFWQD